MSQRKSCFVNQEGKNVTRVEFGENRLPVMVSGSETNSLSGVVGR